MSKVLVFILIACLFGCQNSIVYDKVITQGRPISSSMIANLRVGLSKDAVTEILGSPVLVGAFDSNHWIYLYTYKRHWHRVLVHKNKASLLFKNNILIKIDLT